MMTTVLIFGATGMVGQGVLRECLLEPSFNEIRTIGRTPLGTDHPKLRNILHKNLSDYSAVEEELGGIDICFFCLGMSAAGKTEEEYTKINYDIPLAAGKALLRLNPGLTFIYTSGEGADDTETTKTMWARVRGKTENDLKKLPFKALYIFRPGMIQPLHSIQSKTASYRYIYGLLKPVLPLLKKAFPNFVTSTEDLGRAMITVATKGSDKALITNRDIPALAQR